jgi:hypothetical protein
LLPLIWITTVSITLLHGHEFWGSMTSPRQLRACQAFRKVSFSFESQERNASCCFILISTKFRGLANGANIRFGAISTEITKDEPNASWHTRKILLLMQARQFDLHWR